MIFFKIAKGDKVAGDAYQLILFLENVFSNLIVRFFDIESEAF